MYIPSVGQKVQMTELWNERGVIGHTGRIGTVTEVHLNPNASTPLDEEVWGLMDDYNGNYPEWIARVYMYDPDLPSLVGPGEIEPYNPPTTVGNCDMCGRKNILVTPVISDRYGPTGELCCAEGCPIP